MTIIEAYVIRIKAGLMTIDQVPVRFRAEVEELLNSLSNHNMN